MALDFFALGFGAALTFAFDFNLLEPLANMLPMFDFALDVVDFDTPAPFVFGRGGLKAGLGRLGFAVVEGAMVKAFKGQQHEYGISFVLSVWFEMLLAA